MTSPLLCPCVLTSKACQSFPVKASQLPQQLKKAAKHVYRKHYVLFLRSSSSSPVGYPLETNAVIRLTI